MATEKKNDVPPIPVPPPAVVVPVADLPPVEAQPVVAPPAPEPPAALPAVNPYTAPTQPAAPNPYANPSQPSASNPYGAYQPGPPAPPQGLSIAAMICGIVGLLGSFVGFGFLPSLAGVILGHLAIKRQPYAKGFSVAGLATGYAGVGLSVIWGLFMALAILIPLMMGAAAYSS